MEKLYKPTRKVIVCFSNGETWEEMNDEISLITLNKSGIHAIYDEGFYPKHLKEDQYDSYSFKKVFDRFIVGRDLEKFF